MPNEDENWKLYNNISQLRGELYCDKLSRNYEDKTYTVIYIFDKEGFQSGQLIIPRLDKVGQ